MSNADKEEQTGEMQDFSWLDPNSELAIAIKCGMINASDLAKIDMVRKEKEFNARKNRVLEKHTSPIKMQQRDTHGNGKVRTDYYTYAGWLPNHKLTAKTYEELIEKLHEHYYPSAENRIPTVAEAFERWMAEREADNSVEKLTLVHNRADWNRYWAGVQLTEDEIKAGKMQFRRCDILDKPITEVKSSELIAHYKYLVGDRNISRATLTNLKTVINGAFAWAVNNDYMCIRAKDVDTSAIAKRCKIVDNSDKVWTEEERDTLLNYLEEQEQTVYTLASRMCLMLGCRIGELRALTWDDYFEYEGRKYIKIQHMMASRPGKDGNRTAEDVPYLKKRSTSGQRTLPLSDYVVNVIEELRKINGDRKYILNSAGEKPIPTNRFNENLKKFCRNAGVSEYSSHKARFYVASSLFAANVSDFDIMNYLGHSDIKTSHIYDRRVKTIQIDNSHLESIMGRTIK